VRNGVRESGNARQTTRKREDGGVQVCRCMRVCERKAKKREIEGEKRKEREENRKEYEREYGERNTKEKAEGEARKALPKRKGREAEDT